MSRFRSYSNAVHQLFGIGTILTCSHPALAASCRSDAACTRSFAKAEAVTTSAQRLAAIVELQAAYTRLSDPRLLVSIGNLQKKEHLYETAMSSCLRAQQQAPGDPELQQKAQECLLSIGRSTQSESHQQSIPVVNRVEAKSGSSHAEATVHNNINVAPQISVAPQIQVSPQIHIVQPSPSPRESANVPIYKRWWFWGGLLIGIAGAVSLGIGLAAREPNTDGYEKYRLTLLSM